VGKVHIKNSASCAAVVTCDIRDSRKKLMILEITNCATSDALDFIAVRGRQKS